MRYRDYDNIELSKNYAIINKNNMEYIQKKRIVGTIPELDKKINEYYLEIQKVNNELEYYKNKKDACNTIKNEILYNDILKIGTTIKDKMWYDISCIIDNNNMELYKDLLQVYKVRVNEYNNSLEHKK